MKKATHKRKTRKKPITPRSRITSYLRRLWMYSRERAERKRIDKNTCQYCGSKEHLEVHHWEQPDWDLIIEYIYRHLLVPPEELITLCRKCHKEETDRQRIK